MAPPSDTSQPRLAAGCRWGGTEEDRVILFPEGAIKLQGTGRQVLERCDGQRTFGEIIAELQTSSARRIRRRFAMTLACFWSSCRRSGSSIIRRRDVAGRVCCRFPKRSKLRLYEEISWFLILLP